MSCDEIFVLLSPVVGSWMIVVVWHNEEVPLARVVHLPRLDQGPQRLVDQVDEVLGGGDLAVVGVEPRDDVLHVGHGVGHPQSGQDHAYGVLQRRTGALKI